MKGSISTVARYLLSLTLSIAIITISTSAANSIEPKIKVETAGVVAHRIETAVVMASGIEEETEIELNLKDQYGISSQQGKPYLNYTAGNLLLANVGNTAEIQLKIPNSVGFSWETGKSSKVCITSAESSVDLAPGGC